MTCNCGNPECPNPFFNRLEELAEEMDFTPGLTADYLIAWTVYLVRGEADLIKERVDHYCKMHNYLEERFHDDTKH